MAIVTFFSSGGAVLLERFREGDRAALESVYRAYVGSVTQAVSGALRRHGGAGRRGFAAEVPDLVQEVFTRAFAPRTRRGFDGVREYGPYLGQIARNVVVDHLRRDARQVTIDVTSLIDETSLHPAPADLTNDFADFQTVALVSRYVADLPIDLRRVHEALYVQGLSQRETAEALGLGRQVVRTLEARLRDGLRNALADAGPRGMPPDVSTLEPAMRKVE